MLAAQAATLAHKPDAEALVHKVIAYYQAHGRDQTLAAINAHDSAVSDADDGLTSADAHLTVLFTKAQLVQRLGDVGTGDQGVHVCLRCFGA